MNPPAKRSPLLPRLAVSFAAAVAVASSIIVLTRNRPAPDPATASEEAPSHPSDLSDPSDLSHLPDPATTAAQWQAWQDSGLLIAARSATTAPSALLLDLRPAEEFQRAHAAGAFQVDLLTLETSPLLRGRQVIVMDRGATLPAVMERLATLRTAKNPDLRVLDGGLRAWRDAGGKMAGPAVQDAALYSLTPSEVIALRGRPGWKFTAIDSAVENFHVASLFESPATPALAPDSMTIVLSAHGDHYQEYENHLPQGSAPVYYLTGGAAALSDHVRAASHKPHPQRITMAPSAGQNRRGLPAAASGGCCPGR